MPLFEQAYVVVSNLHICNVTAIFGRFFVWIANIFQRRNKMKKNQIIMSYKGGWDGRANANFFPVLLSVLQNTFCLLFDITMEKREKVKEWIAHECWAREAILDDEMICHDRGARNARAELREISKSMQTAAEVLACIVQIFNRQRRIAVVSTIREDEVILNVICDTSKLTIDPENKSIKVVNEKKVRFILKK
jgi:hypothetical protein